MSHPEDNTHKHFMRRALDEAEEARAAGEFPVGCVLVADSTVVASGRRVHSKSAKKSSGGLKLPVNEIDHAEILALRDLVDNRPDINLSKVIVYTTLEPCLMCFSALIINNISTIVYAYEDAMGGGTNLPLQKLAPFYRKMNITIIPHIMRKESLRLFKNFFASPACNYLQDTMLAEYTLSQSLEE